MTFEHIGYYLAIWFYSFGCVAVGVTAYLLEQEKPKACGGDKPRMFFTFCWPVIILVMAIAVVIFKIIIKPLKALIRKQKS